MKKFFWSNPNVIFTVTWIISSRLLPSLSKFGWSWVLPHRAWSFYVLPQKSLKSPLAYPFEPPAQCHYPKKRPFRWFYDTDCHPTGRGSQIRSRSRRRSWSRRWILSWSRSESVLHTYKYIPAHDKVMSRRVDSHLSLDSRPGGRILYPQRRKAPPSFAYLSEYLLRTLCANSDHRSSQVRSPGHVNWPHLKKWRSRPG